MGAYRGFVVWGAGIVVVLGAFLVFVAAGWPGDANSCIQPTHDTPPQPDSCYCEHFDRLAIRRNEGGVRQPVNTWFNLYAIFTSLTVALFVYFDRNSSSGGTAIRSHVWLPDLYIFVVLFLGLGSMWFHGALKEWGGVTDTLSMYLYAAFLVFYTIYRLWDSDIFFLIGYIITVAVFTIVGELWQLAMPSFPVSLIMILILVAAYLVFESIIWSGAGGGSRWQNWWDHFWWFGSQASLLWWLAVASIALATFFWTFSQTGRFMCDPHSAFQPHGLLWHPLAGAMAVLLYFYWRRQES
jgi:hypothetical protein